MKQPLPKRLLGLLERIVGVFPLTWAGLLVIAGCVLAFGHYGLGRIDLILLGVGAVGIGIAGVSLLLSCLTALIVYLRSTGGEEGEPLRLECGYWTYTGFSLSSMWYIPFVHISWRWLSPESEVRVVRRWGQLHEQIRPDRRGTASAVVRRELSFDSSSVEDLVVTILEDTAQGDEVVIRLAPEDNRAMKEAYPRLLEALGRDGTFRVELDGSLHPGGALIETTYGSIDGSVRTQLAAFEESVQAWAEGEVELGDE